MSLKRSIPLTALVSACGLAVAQSSESTQSSVSIYGRLDVRAVKDIGTDIKALANGSGSRIGFRGTEDLGGGWSAFFDLQHRFNIDTGAQTNAQKFYQQSFVGLDGGKLGRAWFGRDYTPAYFQVMLIADPFDHANVGSLINVNTGSISANRVDNSANYRFQTGGFTGFLQVAAGEAAFRSKQYSTAFLYSGGPIVVGWGYENPGNINDYWSQLSVVYTAGPIIGRFGYGKGKTSTDQKRSAVSIGATYSVDAHRFHVGYGRLDNDTNDLAISRKLGLGWQYFLSKRTNLYVNYGRDNALSLMKWGYDIGIKHNF